MKARLRKWLDTSDWPVTILIGSAILVSIGLAEVWPWLRYSDWGPVLLIYGGGLWMGVVGFGFSAWLGPGMDERQRRLFHEAKMRQRFHEEENESPKAPAKWRSEMNFKRRYFAVVVLLVVPTVAGFADGGWKGGLIMFMATSFNLAVLVGIIWFVSHSKKPPRKNARTTAYRRALGYDD